MTPHKGLDLTKFEKNHAKFISGKKKNNRICKLCNDSLKYIWKQIVSHYQALGKKHKKIISFIILKYLKPNLPGETFVKDFIPDGPKYSLEEKIGSNFRYCEAPY